MSLNQRCRKTVRACASPAFIEQLEPRQLLAGTPAAAGSLPHAAKSSLIARPAVAAIATKVKTTVSPAAPVIGQTITITVRVKPASGSAAARGTIDLLDNDKKTGLTAAVNHAGYARFTFDPGDALFSGSYSFSARYISSSTRFVGSRSRAVSVDVAIPTRTALADGLQIATVTAGAGKAAKKGETLVAQYTGFYAANGQIFDKSSAHAGGFKFVLYSNPESVIPGFDEGAKGMLVGETRVIVIPSALGYNDGQLRVFVVHLLAIT